MQNVRTLGDEAERLERTAAGLPTHDQTAPVLARQTRDAEEATRAIERRQQDVDETRVYGRKLIKRLLKAVNKMQTMSPDDIGDTERIVTLRRATLKFIDVTMDFATPHDLDDTPEIQRTWVQGESSTFLEPSKDCSVAEMQKLMDSPDETFWTMHDVFFRVKELADDLNQLAAQHSALEGAREQLQATVDSTSSELIECRQLLETKSTLAEQSASKLQELELQSSKMIAIEEKDRMLDELQKKHDVAISGLQSRFETEKKDALELCRLTASNAKIEAERQQVTAIADLDKKLGDAAAESARLKQSLEDLQREKSKLETDLATASAKDETSITRAQFMLQGALDEARREIQTNMDHILKLDSELSEVKAEKTRLTSDLGKSILDVQQAQNNCQMEHGPVIREEARLRGEHEKLKNEVEWLCKDRSGLQLVRDNATMDLVDLRVRVSDLETTEAITRVTIERLTTENDQLQSQASDLRVELRTQKIFADVCKDQYEAREGVVHTLRGDKTKLEDSVRDLSLKCDIAKQDLSRAKEETRTLMICAAKALPLIGEHREPDIMVKSTLATILTALHAVPTDDGALFSLHDNHVLDWDISMWPPMDWDIGVGGNIANRLWLMACWSTSYDSIIAYLEALWSCIKDGQPANDWGGKVLAAAVALIEHHQPPQDASLAKWGIACLRSLEMVIRSRRPTSLKLLHSLFFKIEDVICEQQPLRLKSQDIVLRALWEWTRITLLEPTKCMSLMDLFAEWKKPEHGFTRLQPRMRVDVNPEAPYLADREMFVGPDMAVVASPGEKLVTAYLWSELEWKMTIFPITHDMFLFGAQRRMPMSTEPYDQAPLRFSCSAEHNAFILDHIPSALDPLPPLPDPYVVLGLR